ncbi:hypothetical protein GPECTOR_97g763 [Gonium pectorale]|uniref:Small acidic protein-like domain-containing protein n=1 Tax=Gonium pectorale TaxID=33097 RepID=A0A150G177_GONPE|nr:hypothetical protein GPECTOR_97g763 [Gonium pectorale]|eukprot:KXZ43225.1 hypothetical protein GPECTOR_97g763 [Gonium pectorale]
MDSAEIVRAMMAAPVGSSAPGAGGASGGGNQAHVQPPQHAPAATANAQSAALTAEQKRKLLWGAKKVEAAVTQGAQSLFGANRWDRAAEVLETDKDKEKFQRLMGLKGDLAHPQPQPQPPSPGAEAHLAMTREQQERVLSEVEQQYLAGLRRKDNRTVGLGL